MKTRQYTFINEEQSYFPIIMSGLNIDDAAVRLLIVLNIILIAIILLWFVIRIIVPL